MKKPQLMPGLLLDWYAMRLVVYPRMAAWMRLATGSALALPVALKKSPSKLRFLRPTGYDLMAACMLRATRSNCLRVPMENAERSPAFSAAQLAIRG